MVNQASKLKSRSVWVRFFQICMVLVLAICIALTRWIQLRNVLPPLHIPPHPMPADNAYDTFVNATREMEDIDLVGYAVSKKHTLGNQDDREYSLIEKKKFLEENREAVKTLQSGFGLPYVAPAVRSFKPEYPEYAKFRALARLLQLKAQTLKSENRWYEAAETHCDTLELGAMCPHGGSLISGLVGMAITAIGEKDFSNTFKHLNSNEIKLVLHRYERICRKWQPISENIEESKWSTLASLYEISLDGSELSKYMLGDDHSSESGMRKTRLSLAVTYYGKRRIIENITKFYDEWIAYTRLPYDPGRPEPSLPKDAVSEVILPSYDIALVRSTATETKFGLQCLTLALDAYRLDRGVYPTDLSALSSEYLSDKHFDPFASGKPFHYMLKKHGYLLYSIGPDGKDDGGKPLIAGKLDDPTKSVQPRLSVQKEDLGDIVAGQNM